MGSAIWYKKRNGGTKEREKLRKRKTEKGTLRRWNKRGEGKIIQGGKIKKKMRERNR